MYKLDKKELQMRQEMRGRYPEGVRWYAVMVHCGHEKRVRFWLEETLEEWGLDSPRSLRRRIPEGPAGEDVPVSRSEEVFLPIVRPDAKSPHHRPETPSRLLFHSYLFLRCAMNDEIYTTVCDHPSIYQIVGRAYRIPSVLEDDEVLHLKGILESDCNPETIDKCNIGDTAEIVQGLMAGMRGRVLAVNSSTVRLEVSFSFLDMGTSVAVSVPRTDVRIKDECYLELSGERAYHG